MIAAIRTFGLTCSLRISLYELNRNTRFLVLGSHTALLDGIARALVYQVVDEARSELRRGNVDQAMALHNQAQRSKEIIARRIHSPPVRRKRRRHH